MMTQKVDEYPNLYPSLNEPVDLQDAIDRVFESEIVIDYRLTQVARLKDQLKTELDSREALYKKYRRAVNIVDAVDVGATATGIILGGVGTGLLATLIAAPAVPIIMGAAAGCALISAGTKVATRRLRLKARKHDQVRVLAESKLNSIADLVSKALEDGEISHEEFQAVVNEAQRYHDMKKRVQVGTQKKIVELDKATEKALIEQGRKEARNSFMNKIGVGNSQ